MADVADLIPSEIVGSFDANKDIGMVDVATGLVEFGTITESALSHPSHIRRELKRNGVRMLNDRPGAWSIVSAIRDKLAADIA